MNLLTAVRLRSIDTIELRGASNIITIFFEWHWFPLFIIHSLH